MLYRINQAYEQINAKLLQETLGDGWPHGDINFTAFPTYTLDLVNSQAEYDLSSLMTTTNAQTIARTRPLVILGAEVLDNTGIWHPLDPITLEDIRKQGIAHVEYQKTDSLPLEYEKREYMLVLYPAPDNGVSVTLTGGLKIFFLRTADVFLASEVTTGTKEPGFPSPYHMLLVYMAAMPYLINYKPERVGYYQGEMLKLEKGLLGLIGRRNQDDRPIMTNKPINYI